MKTFHEIESNFKTTCTMKGSCATKTRSMAEDIQLNDIGGRGRLRTNNELKLLCFGCDHCEYESAKPQSDNLYTVPKASAREKHVCNSPK
jgi:hypothetical protein